MRAVLLKKIVAFWAFALMVGFAHAEETKSLQFSTYATTSSVHKFASDEAYINAAPDVMRGMHVEKIILEVFRGGDIVPVEDLEKVRDFFELQGFEVWGGIATVPGADFGVLQDGAYGWFNWQAEKTQSELLKVMQDVAHIFDVFIVDDFLCTDDKSAESEAARGSRSWGEYRRDLLTGLSHKLFIEPLKSANPQCTVVIKYPQWYDRFHLFGYDVERQPQIFDQVWVGTETRGQYTQRFGFTQPFEGFVNYRWLAGIAGDKKGGAWFDYGDCDADDFVEQAYQTVLAGAQDVVLFSYAQTVLGEAADQRLKEEYPRLVDLATHVAENPVVGVPAYKPMNSDPGADMYLLDFMGMLGVPIVPTHTFPSEAATLFLPAHAAKDDGLVEHVKNAIDASKTIIVTSALLAVQPDLCALLGLDFVPTPSPMLTGTIEVGDKQHVISPELALECDYFMEDSPIIALNDGKKISYLSKSTRKKSKIWILNSHTYNQADFDAVGEVLLSPKLLGMLELPEAALAKIREAFFQNVDYKLSAPSRVCIQPLGNEGFFLHNYNRNNVQAKLQLPKNFGAAQDKLTGQSLQEIGGALLLDMPPRSRIWVSRNGNNTEKAADTTIYDADSKRDALRNPEIHKTKRQNGVSLLTCELSQDPYINNSTRINVPNTLLEAGSEIVVECEFWDEGAGWIRASLEGATPTRSSNYTRLNTSTFRRAWFGFSIGAKDGITCELTLTDMQHLKSVRLLPKQEDNAWHLMDASVPREVAPMFMLERPMQLVTTAGIDVTGDMDALENSLRHINELAPLMRVLGFNAIESYVTWKRLEPEREGDFDFTFYDAIVKKLGEYDLKWFPLLIVGSGYALPDWFMESPENIGFVCLEHGLGNPIQSIWQPRHKRHVTRVLQAFGAHYGPMGILQGVRLGPSGNYGESQYPASGNWGHKGKAMHIHLGWWAGDKYGEADYQDFLQKKYLVINKLNEVWGTNFSGFEKITPRLPEHMLNLHERMDFTQWYTDSMSAWCEWWALEARKVLPGIVIHQSAGGWGFREAGTDYSAQTKSMTLIDGGIRLTNETDSLEQNIYATRLASTAARHYGVGLGYEPASSHTARGTVGRIFNTIATNGDHFFTYHNNVINTPLAIAKWLENAPLLDMRQAPHVEVAVYYPETFNQIDDSAFRHLYAWGFNPRAAAVRRVVDVDYLDERLIREGFLDEYKVLVFVWGNICNADVLLKIDDWIQQGGTLIYPSFPRGDMTDENGDATVFRRWTSGGTGKGAFLRFPGDMEPPELYGNFVRAHLSELSTLSENTKLAIQTQLNNVFCTVQEDGNILCINYNDKSTKIKAPSNTTLKIEPYAIKHLN